MSFITWTSGFQADATPNMIVGGNDVDGYAIYVARAYFKDGTHPGKFSITTQGQGAIGYGGKEYFVKDFEVAQSTANLSWVKVTGDFHLSNFKALGKGDPVQGGSGPTYQSNEQVTPYYICKATITDRGGLYAGVHCGKVWEGVPSAIPYGTEEFIVDEYEVLAYNG